MFERNAVKLKPVLYAQAVRRARELGYPSAAAFVEHLVEKALREPVPEQDDRNIQEQLEGLGYLR